MNWFTELAEGLGIALDAVRANKLRSVLTTLGIIIGIATVTLMGTAIDSLNAAFHDNISFLGADKMYVSRMSWFINSELEWEKMQRRPRINLEQFKSVAAQLVDVRGIAPRVDTRSTVRYGNKSAGGVSIMGTSDQYLQISAFSMAEGRFISPSESAGGRPVCVIGLSVATNLFPNESPLGKKLQIGARRLEVIGVLDKQGSFLGMTSLDNRVIIPYQQFLLGYTRIPDFTIEIKAKNVADLEDLQEEVRGVLRKVRHVPPGEPDDFAINRQEQFIKTFYSIAGVIAAVGLVITGLSLLVGGIGIMNIMFVSVAERTKEIGVRKAIGARRRTILLQFLLEAATICLVGGLIALGFTWLFTLAISHWFFSMSMSVPVMLLAIAVSVLTGVVSGFLPAWRGARMDPVEALRNE